MQDDEGEKIEADASDEEGVKVEAEEGIGAAFGGNGDKQTYAEEKKGEIKNGEKKGDGGTGGDHGLLKDW